MQGKRIDEAGGEEAAPHHVPVMPNRDKVVVHDNTASLIGMLPMVITCVSLISAPNTLSLLDYSPVALVPCNILCLISGWVSTVDGCKNFAKYAG